MTCCVLLFACRYFLMIPSHTVRRDVSEFIGLLRDEHCIIAHCEIELCAVTLSVSSDIEYIY